MKKLLFITPGFPKTEKETHVVPFVQQFLRAFHEQFPDIEMTIVTIHKPLGIPYQWNGINVIPLNGNDVKYPDKIFFLIKSFFKIRKLQQEKKFDGILNFWFQEFSVLSRWLKCKNITWFQGQDVRKSNLKLRVFKPDPKQIIAISPFNNDILFETIGIRASQIIPIGIKENTFPAFNVERRSIDVLGAGWLTPLKNFRLFLEVILEVKKIHPNIRAAIAGTGIQEAELKQFVHKNHLEENVTFSGLLSHAEVLHKMNESKIFLHTSTFEGGATVYSEALFSGCQLVGTLPLFDRQMENFHLHSEKSEIIARINSLLANLPTPKRISYYSMDLVCEKVYRLFY